MNGIERVLIQELQPETVSWKTKLNFPSISCDSFTHIPWTKRSLQILFIFIRVSDPRRTSNLFCAPLMVLNWGGFEPNRFRIVLHRWRSCERTSFHLLQDLIVIGWWGKTTKAERRREIANLHLWELCAENSEGAVGLPRTLSQDSLPNDMMRAACVSVSSIHDYIYLYIVWRLYTVQVVVLTVQDMASGEWGVGRLENI